MGNRPFWFSDESIRGRPDLSNRIKTTITIDTDSGFLRGNSLLDRISQKRAVTTGRIDDSYFLAMIATGQDIQHRICCFYDGRWREVLSKDSLARVPIIARFHRQEKE